MSDRFAAHTEKFDYEGNDELRTRHFEVFDELRRRRSAIYTPDPGYWMLLTMDDIHEALQRYDLFGNTLSAMKRNREHRVPYRLIPSQVDPPEHTHYRKILNPLLTPTKVKALEPRVRAAARRLAQEVKARGHCEFMDDVARPLVAEVFLHLFGLPIAERDRFFKIMQMAFIPSAEDEDGSGVQAAIAELQDVLREHLNDRRANPKDDLLSALAHSTVDGEQIDEDDFLALAQNVLLGGLETTTAMLGYFIRHFAQDPQLRERLQAERELLPSAVEEILRLYSPVSLSRVALEDVDFGGCPMKKGDLVVLPLAAATRDEKHFEDAERLSLDRGATRHITFGAGPHRCVGSHLARVELVAALDEWHREIPQYRLADHATLDDIVLGLSGPVRVDIVVEPAA